MSSNESIFSPWDASDRLPALLGRYEVDRESIARRYATPYSPQRRSRLRAFQADWRSQIDALSIADLSRADQADCLLFANLLDAEERRIATEERQLAEIEPLTPFLASLVRLDESRRDLDDPDPREAAGVLDAALDSIRDLEAALTSNTRSSGSRPAVAMRAAAALDKVRHSLEAWYGFYAGYDPAFTWWVERPYRALEAALGSYETHLRRNGAGAENQDAIVGDPVGREALEAEIRGAYIPYSPEDLVDIGRREGDWCMAELRRAAADMGLGDDWRAAVERAKLAHVPPGGQPSLVRDLAAEAIAYVQDNDLVTVPPLAAECWRMEMMSPERQKVNPFFLGGETIQVSYPTNAMEHKEKLMSLRGNNAPFSRATVQHELVPGHHLQGFYQARCRPYRRQFSTPFWTEGWTLGWELLLWDLGFPRTPEERVGMLFWRLHRCVRVVFSIGFHLGELTPAECVEMLVQEVGHERENAIGEVRRSCGGDYPALYQCAYLIGGLQIHALRTELVGAGRMTMREFHDAVMRENCMPIAVLRALLTSRAMAPAECSHWRFYGASS